VLRPPFPLAAGRAISPPVWSRLPAELAVAPLVARGMGVAGGLAAVLRQSVDHLGVPSRRHRIDRYLAMLRTVTGLIDPTAVDRHRQ
jgi:hypothetical protein